MHLFSAMTECHNRLLASAEAMRLSLDDEEVSQRLFRLRFEMAIASRDNLAATQRLWSRIEREVPDIGQRIHGYDRMKSMERELHIKYAEHIAAWPVAAISADFKAFVHAKLQFLDDLSRHIRSLDTDLFEPASRMLKDTSGRNARVA